MILELCPPPLSNPIELRHVRYCYNFIIMDVFLKQLFVFFYKFVTFVDNRAILIEIVFKISSQSSCVNYMDRRCTIRYS